MVHSILLLQIGPLKLFGRYEIIEIEAIEKLSL